MTPYYADAWLTVYQGDCREVLPTLEAGSVDCVVTSPPYWMQRSYLAADLPEKAREIGQEIEYADYQDTLVAICRELRRVLKPEGSLWLVLGDKFRANGGEYRYPGDLGKQYKRGQATTPIMRRKWTHGYPPEVQRKSLLLVPYRIALALIADGWVLRDEIIWAKTNALPESVQDRFARRHEVLFRFTAGQRAYFDLNAVKRPLAASTVTRISQAGLFDQEGGAKQDAYDNGRTHRQATRNLANTRIGGTRTTPDGVTRLSGANWAPGAGGANPGDVWSLATSGARGRGFAHQAMFPPALIEPAILATSPRGGVILDPFAGTGTTAEVANALGRRSVLIELDPASLEAISVRTSKRPMVEVPA
jgi:DNA modification methylase